MLLFPLFTAVNKEDERLINKTEKQYILYDSQHPFYGNILKNENGELLGVTSEQTVHQLHRKKADLRKLY